MAIMVAARRPGLPDPDEHENAGLVADRWLKQHDDAKESARQLIETVSGSAIPDAYRLAFDRWNRIVTTQMPGAVVLKATLRGPLAIGLGVGSPLENGFSIRRPYGVPYLPGSGIKGMCRRAAFKLTKTGGMDESQFLALFGATENDAAEGIAIFHDAWLDPTSLDSPFQLDTITVHHQNYYGTQGLRAPTDFDEPVPVPFLVVRPGVSFRVVVEMPPETTDAGWGEFVNGMAAWAFGHLGIGGKTNAGYGYCDVVLETISSRASVDGMASSARFDVTEQLASMRGLQDLSKVDQVLDRIAQWPFDERRAAAILCSDKLKALKWWVPKNSEKPRYIRIMEFIGE